MKYYKMTYDFKCINLTYEVGKTYTLIGDLKPCEVGFHFCKNPDNIFSYHDLYAKNLVLLEIDVIGDVIDNIDKSVTNKIKVLREVPVSEWNSIFVNHKFDENGNCTFCKLCEDFTLNITYKDNKIVSKTYICEGEEKTFDFKHEYDENGNLILETDEVGTIIYNYNSCGKVVYKKAYNYSPERSVYDKNNNLIEYTDRNGVVAYYKYDKHNNLILWARGNYFTKYSYDKRGNQIAWKSFTKDGSQSGYEVHRKFDRNNNCIFSKSSSHNVVNQSFDNKGNLIRYTYTKNGVIQDNYRVIIQNSSNTY